MNVNAQADFRAAGMFHFVWWWQVIGMKPLLKQAEVDCVIENGSQVIRFC